MNHTPQPAASDELFPVEAVKMDSPRLRWMKEHGVITYYHAPGHGIEPCWFAGFQACWPALSGVDFFQEETSRNGDMRVGEGDTEDEAIVHLLTCWDARKQNIKLWNEEQSP